MMEKLQVPQTHLGLKEMIRQVDEDQDNKINFKEVSGFFFIFTDFIKIINITMYFLSVVFDDFPQSEKRRTQRRLRIAAIMQSSDGNRRCRDRCQRRQVVF